MGTYENFMKLPDDEKKTFFEVLKKLASSSGQNQPSLTDDVQSFAACLSSVSRPQSPERKSPLKQKTLDQWVVKTKVSSSNNAEKTSDTQEFDCRNLPPNSSFERNNPNFESEQGNCSNSCDENNANISPFAVQTLETETHSTTRNECAQKDIFKQMNSGKELIVVLKRTNLKDYLHETELCNIVGDGLSKVSQVSSTLQSTSTLDDETSLTSVLSEAHASSVPEVPKTVSENINNSLYNLRNLRFATDSPPSAISTSNEIAHAFDAKKADAKELCNVMSKGTGKTIPDTNAKQRKKRLHSKNRNENCNLSSAPIIPKKLDIKNSYGVVKNVSPVKENQEKTIKNVASNSILDVECPSGSDQSNVPESCMPMNSKDVTESVPIDSRLAKEIDSVSHPALEMGSEHNLKEKKGRNPKTKPKKQNNFKNTTSEPSNKVVNSLNNSAEANNCSKQSNKACKEPFQTTKVLSESGKEKCKPESASRQLSGIASERSSQIKTKAFKLKNILPQSVLKKKQRKRNLHSKVPSSEIPIPTKIKVESELHCPVSKHELNKEMVNELSGNCVPLVVETSALDENSMQKKRGRPCKNRKQRISSSESCVLPPVSPLCSPDSSKKETVLVAQNLGADAKLNVSLHNEDDVHQSRNPLRKRNSRSSSGSTRLSSELQNESCSPPFNCSTQHKNLSSVTDSTFKKKSNSDNIQSPSNRRHRKKGCSSKSKKFSGLESCEITVTTDHMDTIVPSLELQNNAESSSHKSNTNKTEVSSAQNISNETGMPSNNNDHSLSSGSKKSKNKVKHGSLSKKLNENLENIVVTVLTDCSSNKEKRTSSIHNSIATGDSNDTSPLSGLSPCKKQKQKGFSPVSPKVRSQVSASDECVQNCSIESVLCTPNSSSNPIVIQTDIGDQTSPSSSSPCKSEKQHFPEFKQLSNLKNLVVTISSESRCNNEETVAPDRNLSRQIVMKSDQVNDEVSSSTNILNETTPTTTDSNLETDAAASLYKNSGSSPYTRSRRKKISQSREQDELNPLKCSLSTIPSSISENDVSTSIALNGMHINTENENADCSYENVEIPSDIEMQLDNYLNTEKNIEEVQMNYEAYSELSNLCSTIGVSLDELFQHTEIANAIKTGSCQEIFLIRGHKLISGNVVPSICKTTKEHFGKVLHESQINLPN